MTIFQIVLIAFGLSMDASAVAMSDGLAECFMSRKKSLCVATVFGFFQGFMPFLSYLTGYLLLGFIEGFMPYIILVILLVLGVRMILESIKNNTDTVICISKRVLLLQAVATSIDAFAVGFIFAAVKMSAALLYCAIICLITFVNSLIAIYLGKKFGCMLANKAQLLGGLILIVIGIKLFAEFITSTI